MSDQFDLVVKPAAGSIASNIADLKAWVESVTEPYIGQVVTDDQAKFAKKDLADLRKLKSALEDERKKAKAIIMEPYSQFETMYREAVASLDAAIAGIDKQVKEIEAEARKRREEDTRAFILKSAMDIGGSRIENVFLREDVLGWFTDPSWLLASASRVKTEKEIRERILAAVRDIEAIETASGEFKASCLDEYYRTGSLAAALERKKALEDIRVEMAKAEEKAAATSPEAPTEKAPDCHQATDTPYVPPVADRIFFDIPVEPDDEAEKELVHIPAVLVLPRYKMHILREIMTKLGMKIMKPSAKEAC